MKGVLPWSVRWACSPGTRDFCFTLAALVSQVQNIFFLTVLYFNSFAPIALRLGQAVVLGHLPISMCLWFCDSLTAVAEKRTYKYRQTTNMAGGRSLDTLVH
jgi:hypothetical protein